MGLNFCLGNHSVFFCYYIFNFLLFSILGLNTTQEIHIYRIQRIVYGSKSDTEGCNYAVRGKKISSSAYKTKHSKP